MPLLLLLAAGLVVGPDAALWNIGIQAQVREGTPEQPGLPSPATVAQIEPAATLSDRIEETRIAATYAPRFLFGNGVGSGQSQILHRGRGELVWSTEKTEGLSLSEDFSVGEMSFSLQNGTPPPTFDPRLAAIQSIPYLSSLTTAAFFKQLEPRLRLDAAAHYTLSGGRDAAAQALLPREQGPSTEVGLQYAATRSDTLELQTSGIYTRLTTGTATGIGNLLLGLRKNLGDGLELRVAGGPSVAHTKSSARAGVTVGTRVAGSGIVTVTQQFPMRGHTLSASVNAAAIPVIDPFSGGAVERASGGAGLAYTFTPEIRFAASGSVARDLDSRPAGALGAEASLSFVPGRSFALTIGARGNRLTGSAAVANAQNSEVAGFLVVTAAQQGGL